MLALASCYKTTDPQLQKRPTPLSPSAVFSSAFLCTISTSFRRTTRNFWRRRGARHSYTRAQRGGRSQAVSNLRMRRRVAHGMERTVEWCAGAQWRKDDTILLVGSNLRYLLVGARFFLRGHGDDERAASIASFVEYFDSCFLWHQ